MIIYERLQATENAFSKLPLNMESTTFGFLVL